MRTSGDTLRTTSIVMGSDLLRTALFTTLFGGLMAMLAYFSICAAAGEGRRLFQVIGTLAVFLVCGAIAIRRRTWLRVLLVLWALGICALLVDQLSYLHWHKRIDALMGRLQQGAGKEPAILSEPVHLSPTSFRIDRDEEVELTFEPPPLAWTYRADSASPVAHSLMSRWYRFLSDLTEGKPLDRVARTIVTPHLAYSVSLRSGERGPVCEDGAGGSWVITVETVSPRGA